MSLNWQNLDENRCPACGGEYKYFIVRGSPYSIACSCGFKVNRERYREQLHEAVRKREEEEALEREQQTQKYAQ